jgi:hypothetical protein
MNTFLTESISELNRQRIIDEMEAIRMESEATGDQNWISRSLFVIGNWMIVSGEKLRLQYTASRIHSGRVRHLKHITLDLKHKS